MNQERIIRTCKLFAGILINPVYTKTGIVSRTCKAKQEHKERAVKQTRKAFVFLYSESGRNYKNV